VAGTVSCILVELNWIQMETISWSVWFVWFVLFIWLNETNQMDQINQINQKNGGDGLRRGWGGVTVCHESCGLRSAAYFCVSAGTLR
jgi:hypothetical protein